MRTTSNTSVFTHKNTKIYNKRNPTKGKQQGVNGQSPQDSTQLTVLLEGSEESLQQYSESVSLAAALRRNPGWFLFSPISHEH